MTRLDHGRFSYLDGAENARDYLLQIPDQALAQALTARHDQLVAEGKSRADIRSDLMSLEPSGSKLDDYAVSLYLDDVYGDRTDHIDWEKSQYDAVAVVSRAEQLERLERIIVQRGLASQEEAGPNLAGEGYAQSLADRGFLDRVGQLRDSGRMSSQTEAMVHSLVENSSSLTELHERLVRQAGPDSLAGSELRYLESTLIAPEGTRPETWQEAEAHARPYVPTSVPVHEHTQRIDRDQQMSQQMTM